MAVNDSMLIDEVNENDEPVSEISRRDVLRLGINFRVAHDLIFNSRGELLIQQLASNRSRHPGYWGSSVAAYLFAGESYRAAAERRLTEELGVRGTLLNYIGKTSMRDENSEKFIGVFTGINDGPFSFDRSHISQLEFLPVATIHELQAAKSRTFTPTFLWVLNFYETRRVPGA